MQKKRLNKTTSNIIYDQKQIKWEAEEHKKPNKSLLGHFFCL